MEKEVKLKSVEFFLADYEMLDNPKLFRFGQRSIDLILCAGLESLVLILWVSVKVFYSLKESL